MDAMLLRTRAVGSWPMNTYVLVCPTTGRSVLLDPGADPEALAQMLADTTPEAILLTHTHPDHVGALDEMRNRLGVPVYAYDGPHFQGMNLQVDRGLNDGEEVQVGNHRLHVHYAPGHIEDQICFAIVDDHRVIVGDTIFAGGPGKTWSAQQFQTTLATLRKVVLSWPDETVCYPGHGPDFRLGDIRDRIEGFLSRDLGQFFGDATWDM